MTHKLDVNTKVIFLDFDGVLNTSAYMMQSRERSEGINPVSVRIIDAMLNLTGAKLVVSSSWRIGRTIEELNEILQNKGMTNEVWDVTPQLSGCRGNEIKRWIDVNRPSDLVFNEYLIIDDDSDMLLEHQNHFIHTAFDCGITPNIAYRAVYKLKGMRNWEYEEKDHTSYENPYCADEFYKMWNLSPEYVDEDRPLGKLTNTY